MRQRVLGGAVALVALAAIAMSPTTAVADDGQPVAVEETYVDSAGMVHYAFDPATRPGAKIIYELGTPSRAGGCTFQGAGSGMSPTAQLTVVDELTFEPATCARTLSTATYPIDSVPRAVTKELAGGNDMATASTTISSTPSVPTRVTHFQQKLSAWIADPIGIHVSETKITRTWDSTGGWSNSHQWGWYTPTGWSRTSWSQIDTSAVGDTIGTFMNWAFCNPKASTTDQHYQTRLTTNPSGAWWWSYSMNKSGDCSWLLSYHYAHG